MRVTWKDVDGWREEAGMRTADLARKAQIPERTIYEGIRRDRRLQAATAAVIRNIFPDKFEGAKS